MKVLVTGGAGYIGSHAVAQLMEDGHDVTVIDNLSTGHRWAVGDAELIEGSVGDPATLDKAFASKRYDIAMHFAASTVVPESVDDPVKYFRNNTVNTLNFLERLVGEGVDKLVFSSTAAVYGNPETADPITEAAPLAPVNPYGRSKMMSEGMIEDIARASNLNYVILRYFNVAGAHPGGHIGQATPEATHLLKVAAQAVVGRRDHVAIFGDDYPTPDGTCVRDYIHVCDLIDAHVLAMHRLCEAPVRDVFNCGYGHGYSVREVLDTMQKVAGKQLDVRVAGRRAGDPVRLVADAGKLRNALQWTPKRDSLEMIATSALAWERAYNG